MDLQARKLKLITYLAQLESEVDFDRIERFVLNNYKVDNSKIDIDILRENLKLRIDISEEYIKEGKFKTLEELEILSEKW